MRAIGDRYCLGRELPRDRVRAIREWHGRNIRLLCSGVPSLAIVASFGQDRVFERLSIRTKRLVPRVVRSRGRVYGGHDHDADVDVVVAAGRECWYRFDIFEESREICIESLDEIVAIRHRLCD